MNQLEIRRADWDDLEGLITAYFMELGYKNDGFHNSKIFEGDAYEMFIEEECVGFFSLGASWKKGNMLRAFYVIPEKRGVSMEVFEQVTKEFDIEAILVVSNDAHLISLAFEKMNECQASFDMQAFNFVYGESLRPARFGMEHMVLVQSEEYEEVERVTEGLWDGCFGDPNFTFYAIKYGEEVMGYGGIAKMEHNPRNVDVGNFVFPAHRQKGVGRSLIINLSKIAISKGYTPVAGCWYGNKKSLATLKSSGMIAENRIFYVRIR